MCGAGILKATAGLASEGVMDFSDLGKMKEMMGQAKQMQEQMEKKLAATVVEASSGGGVVTVRMNGKKEVLRVKIEPTALGSTAGDLELLEDLIAAAINEAGRRADEAIKSSVAGTMGGVGVPGLPGAGQRAGSVWGKRGPVSGPVAPAV